MTANGSGGEDRCPVRLFQELSVPMLPLGDPEIDDVARQRGLAADCRAEPPRHALRSRVLRIDAVNDAIDLQVREGPADRGTPRLDGIAFVAKLLRYAPAHLEARPSRRTPWTDAAHKSARRFF